MEILHIMGIILLLVTIGTITHPTVYALLLGPQPKGRVGKRRDTAQSGAFVVRVYPTDSR